jgi:hypothetical protein
LLMLLSLRTFSGKKQFWLKLQLLKVFGILYGLGIYP